LLLENVANETAFFGHTPLTRQNPEKTLWRPRLPLAGAYHGMSLSSQIVNDPWALSAALYAIQLVVLSRVSAPLGAVMPRGHQPGEPALCNKAGLNAPSIFGRRQHDNLLIRNHHNASTF
jgi:hypothetical protein